MQFLLSVEAHVWYWASAFEILWVRFLLQVLQFSPVSILPPMLHTNFNFNTVITRTGRQSIGTFIESIAVLGIIGALDRKVSIVIVNHIMFTIQ
jgi:hypothetical protein